MRTKIMVIALLAVVFLVSAVMVNSAHVYRRTVITNANFKLFPTNPDSIVNTGSVWSGHLTVAGKTVEGITVVPDTLRLWTWIAKTDEDSTRIKLYDVMTHPDGTVDSTAICTNYIVTSTAGGWYVTTFSPSAGTAIGSVVSVLMDNMTPAAADTNIYINSFLEALNY
jgi:hypothetical protein